MRTSIFFLMAFMLLSSVAFAQAWPNALSIQSFDNIEFYGSGLRTLSGNTLLTCVDQRDGINKTRFEQFNELMGPVFNASFSMDGSYGIVQASDGNFILLQRKTNELRAFKTDVIGTQLWDPEGIVFWTGDYFSSSEFIMQPDNAGGVYFGWAPDGMEPEELTTVQHLDTNGHITMPGSSTIDSPAPNYLTELKVLPDSDVLLSYISRGSQRIRRLSPSGNTGWDIAHEIEIPSSMLPDGSLCLLEDGSFAVGTAQGNHIGLQRYQSNGLAIWSNPVIVHEFPGQINRVNISRSSDNGIFVAATNLFGGSLRLQKVSSNGDVMFSQDLTIVELNTNLVWKLVPGDQGDCYIVYSARGLDYIQVSHILANGNTQWSHPAMSGVFTAVIQPAFYVEFAGGKLKVFWRDRRLPESGVYVQSFNPDGTNIYQNNGLPLITGTHGYIGEHKVCALANKTCMVWEEQEESYQNKNLKIQIARYDGAMSFPQGGGLLYRDENAHGQAPRISVYGDNFLVTWSCIVYGTSGTETSYRAQLIDQDGNFLWAENGIPICPEAGSYISSVVGSDLFIFWRTGDEIDYQGHIQKYLGGIPQYPPQGLVITQSNPEITMSILHPVAFIGPYLVVKYSYFFYAWGPVKVLKIEADGSLSPGFNAWGNDIVELPTGYGQDYKNACLVGDKLLVYMRNGTDHVLQIVNSSGELQYGSQGMIGSEDEVFPMQSGTDIYSITEPNPQLSFIKRNSAGELLWQRTIQPNPPLPEGSSLEGLFRLDAETFMVTFWDKEYLGRFRWFYLDNEGFLSNPVMSIVPAKSKNNWTVFDANETGLSALWGEGGDGYAYDLNKLSLLRVNHDCGAVGPIIPYLDFSFPYPNPFGSSTSFRIKTEQEAESKVAVYNLRGQLVKVVFQGALIQDKSELSWDGTDEQGKPVAKGIYLIKAKSGKLEQTRKVLKLR